MSWRARATFMSDDLDEEVWLRTNEVEEFIDALEHSAELAEHLADDVKLWRWLIISLHSALQGACVSALRGRDTAGITMLTEKSAAEVWHWLDVDSRHDPEAPMPKERLAAPLDLFARVRNQRYLPAPHALDTGPEILADVIRLNRLRNKFVHFVPQGWSLELSGMPRIVRHVSEVIEHLAVTHPTFWHHLDQRKRGRISSALKRLRSGVAAWAATYVLQSRSEQ